MAATRGFIYGAATTPLDTRKADATKLVTNADGTPRIGVVGPNPSIVISDASTSPMRVGVIPAGFATQRAAGDGVAHWTNDGLQYITVTKPVSQSWIVTVYAKHDDTTAGDADNLPVIGTVTGSAAALPVEAAIPAGALKIATILVPSTATSTQSTGVTITNVYPMTVEAGGVVPFRLKSELDLWTTARPGQYADVMSDSDALNGMYVFRSGSWKKSGSVVLAAPPAVLAGSIPPANARLLEQAGQVTVSTSAGGDVTLTFPTAFPNGLLSVQLQRQGFGTYGVTIEVGSDTVPPTLAAYVFRVFAANGTPVASAAGLKYSFVAIGW